MRQQKHRCWSRLPEQSEAVGSNRRWRVRGQERLDDGVAAAEAPVGKGTLYLFGPEISFRAQPHGTFKLLFHTLYGM